MLRRAKAVPGVGEKVIAVQVEFNPFELEAETFGFAAQIVLAWILTASPDFVPIPETRSATHAEASVLAIDGDKAGKDLAAREERLRSEEMRARERMRVMEGLRIMEERAMEGVTDEEVDEVVRSSEPWKAPDSHGIQMGLYPTRLKQSNTIPTYKAGKKDKPARSRTTPWSNTPRHWQNHLND
ncbi:hypothetical protein B0H17DRAFT_1204989 [Mycena rosella]|uniref:Uncharacterized protein n=1 Tax=Mycena rosella TaxID=1033263 RepID=A0AAD7D834_MYCRO|nr:hypothetical protein B0H17DRAFT_1204989 [Mycena rosella]